MGKTTVWHADGSRCKSLECARHHVHRPADDTETIARRVIGEDALAGVGYDKYLPWVIRGVEAGIEAARNERYTK